MIEYLSSAAVALGVCPTSNVAGSPDQTCNGGGSLCTALVKWYPGIIYRLTSPSGKSYVGQTRTLLKTRLQKHGRKEGGCHALRGAVAKYGFESFIQETLLTGVHPANLNTLECAAIWLAGSLAPLGYNLTTGGNASRILSDETRRRISISKKNSSSETRALISDTMKELWRSPKTREALLVPFNTPEYRAKRTRIAKNRWADPVERARMLEFFRNPESKRKASEGLKKAWALPENKLKKSAASKRMWELKGLREAQAARGAKLRNDFQKDTPRRLALLAYWANPENRKKRSLQVKARQPRQKG